MQIDIDPLSDVPLYQQLRDRVVEGIAAGRLEPGEQLASVRQLAVSFGINVATVSKGYDLLRQEGLIRTNHKSGSVIARGPDSGPASSEFVDDWRARLTTLLAEASAQGLSSSRISESVADLLAGFGHNVKGGRA
ncbi:GntR family transcriptional regulator [Rathayibacter soli]|uniref:GntR family transcriptional regulator n=1 Tax=Rathayibacter soli TaxID=3144168 RepID=UPI0027E438BB|nr:GntR family transcriptional regulator [Glaciibacter superstes]